LGLRRNLELDLTSLQRRRGHLAAAKRDVQRDRDRDAHVLALALEHRVGCHLHLGAQSGDAKDRPLFHAGRDLDLDPTPARQLHGAACPPINLGQADRDRRLDVLRLRSRSPAAAAAKDRPENVAEASTLTEHVLHLFGSDRPVLDPRAGLRSEPARRPGSAWRGPSRPRGRPVGTVLVVKGPLLGIGKHVVRLRDLLEARLGLLVARVQVGMVLARKLAEGGRDLFLRRGPRHAEHLVVVLDLGHQLFDTRLRCPTNPGRSR
jgi:hypothetical protein